MTKKVLTVEEIEAQAAIELPDRAMLSVVECTAHLLSGATTTFTTTTALQFPVGTTFTFTQNGVTVNCTVIG
jgi:hypothetical protein